MGEFYDTLVNYTVFPTENDHYGSGGVGAGRVLQELTLAPLFKLLGEGSFLISGFTLPSTGSGITHELGAGTAVVDGYYIAGTDTITIDVTLADSGTDYNYVYLKMEYDGSSKLYRPLIEVNLTGTAPSNSLYLGRIAVDTTQITGAYPSAPARTGVIRGYYTGDAASTKNIDIGCGSQIPTMVFVSRLAGSTPILALGLRIALSTKEAAPASMSDFQETIGVYMANTSIQVIVGDDTSPDNARNYIPIPITSGFRVGANTLPTNPLNAAVDYHYIAIL